MVANKDVDTNTDTYSEETLSAIASAKANITNRCGTLTNVVAVNLKKVQKLFDEASSLSLSLTSSATLRACLPNHFYFWRTVAYYIHNSTYG